MWNAFFQWLTDKSPLMLLIVVVAVIVWLIAKFYYKRFKILEERVETLPCDKHEDTFTQIKEDSSQIYDKKIQPLEEHVKSLPCETHTEILKQIKEDLLQFNYKRFQPVEKRVETLPCDTHAELLKQIKEDLLQFNYKRFQPVEKRVETLPCDTHAELLKQIKEDLLQFNYKRFQPVEERVNTLPCDKHEDTFTQIKEELLQIKTFLMTKNPKTASLFSVKQSPRELNKAGKEVFAEINGEDFLQTNSEKLLNAIARKQPRTALDVEISANEVLIEFVNTEMFNDLKKWVYNSPTKKMLIDGQEKDYAFTIADICFILSLPLRDKYLSLHPEIK